uniref:Uncharacterized protein n=1 Tax=Panagrolaimus sp. ES5 TaxID=591445 RepID=A0AC34FLA3_9BILA
MATKKDKICLSDKQQFFVNADSHDKNQYSNFNLNGNYSYSSISSSVQSHSKTKTSNINSFDSHDIGNNEGKKKLQTSIKSSYGFAEEQVQKLFEDRQGQNLSQQHNSSNVNNSTLSLHIAAYENSLETSDERSDEEEEVSKKKSTGFLQKWQNAKQIFTDSKAINQNPFEFPRQQEQYEIPPEVMQFIASQNVLNPNEMDAKTEGYCIFKISIYKYTF